MDRNQFFCKDPTDVSVKDVHQYGLPALLVSSLPLCYFIVYLLQEQSIENLVKKKVRYSIMVNVPPLRLFPCF